MTRQNVTDGPREILTRKCPTCGGDGIVYSEASAAIDVERRLRALAAGSRSQAFRVEGTPAVVVRNRRTGATKTLLGAREISYANIIMTVSGVPPP